MIMAMELMQATSLKEKLDEIDNEIIEVVKHGFYQSHFRKNVGMWEKGEAIYTFGGGKSIKFGFWTELEKQTGRDDQHLKRWYDLYRQYPEKQKYIEQYARPNATKALERYLKTLAVLQSGTPEWWTPKEYIEAVREVMGEIDLESIISIKKVLEYENSIQISMPKGEGEKT